MAGLTLHDKMSLSRAEKPNLVIGAVRGYGFEQLRPFVVSLQRTTFPGDLVLLWNDLSAETLAALHQHGVKLEHFSYRGSGALNSWSRFWPQIGRLLRLPVGNPVRAAVYKKILNLAFVRYLHALDFLEANAGRYRNVLLTDVRDVIFQDNPFRDPLPGEMVAFLESPHMVYGLEPMNDGWILENYGAEMKAKLQENRISCCGTVMGAVAGMIEYLRAFVSEIVKLKSVEHGADTSVHNVLVRDTLKNQITVIDNFERIVGTVNPKSELTMGISGLVLGANGQPIPVLHQYDRLPDLASRLIQQLSFSEMSRISHAS